MNLCLPKLPKQVEAPILMVPTLKMPLTISRRNWKKWIKKEFEAKQFAEYKDQFQWFFGHRRLLSIFGHFHFGQKNQVVKKIEPV